MVEGGSLKGIKQRHRQLAERFARDNEVIYIDEPGNIITVFISREKPTSNLWSWMGGLRQVEGKLHSWTPPPGLPFGYIFPLVNGWNHFWYRFWYSIICKRRPEKPVLIITNVLGLKWLDFFGERLRIYDCCDEITGFFVPGLRPEIVRRAEKKLMDECDLVVCSAPYLLESKSPYARKSVLIRNAADVAHFRRAIDEKLPAPVEFQGLEKPVVGFYGYLGDWLDWEIIEYCLRNAPDLHFILIGPAARGIIPNLRAENLTYTGPKPYEELPAYLAHFNCAMMPFRHDEFTRTFNPVKGYEYLASGCPPVGVPLPELKLLGEHIYFGDDGPSFLEAIRRAIEEDTPERRRARADSVVSEDWDSRVEEFYRAVENLELSA